MDESYGAVYARLYRTHWWWRAREAYLSQLLTRHLAPGEAGEALDFGCGDGLFMDVLARFGTPSGIEPHGELLDPNGKWRNRIAATPLTEETSQRGRYGLVVALDVLEHLEQPEAAVAELVRRTRPGGLWVVTVPAFQSLWTSHDDLNQHVKRYRRHDLAALLRGGGLEVLDVRYLFAWPAAAKLLVRAKEAIFGAVPSSPRVPPAALNALLYALCRAEQTLFGVVPPPFGSSVVAVARLSTDARPSP